MAGLHGDDQNLSLARARGRSRRLHARPHCVRRGGLACRCVLDARVGDTRGDPVVQKGGPLRISMFPFCSRCATSRPCRLASTGRVLPGASRVSPRHIPRAVPPAPIAPARPRRGDLLWREKHVWPRVAAPPRVWQESRAVRARLIFGSPIASAKSLGFGDDPRDKPEGKRVGMARRYVFRPPSPPPAPPPDTRSARCRRRAGRRRRARRRPRPR
jgi:hypothetical protein